MLRSALKLLVGLTIFVGLPLVAWGVSDIPSFFGNAARLGYVLAVSLIQLVVVITMPDVGSGRDPGRKIVRRQRLALLPLQIIPLAIVVAAPYGDRRNFAILDESYAVRMGGLALFVLGMGLMHWAEAALGRLFSVQVTLQEGHRLVTEGPYRVLRHPRYLGIVLFAIGLSLIFRSWLGLILVAPLTLVLLWRIFDEEKLMGEEFGPEWADYSRHTWRLIPFIF